MSIIPSHKHDSEFYPCKILFSSAMRSTVPQWGHEQWFHSTAIQGNQLVLRQGISILCRPWVWGQISPYFASNSENIYIYIYIGNIRPPHWIRSHIKWWVPLPSTISTTLHHRAQNANRWKTVFPCFKICILTTCQAGRIQDNYRPERKHKLQTIKKHYVVYIQIFWK